MKKIINIINRNFKPLKCLNDRVDKTFINDLKSAIKQYNVNNKLQALKIIEFLEKNYSCELSVELKKVLILIKKIYKIKNLCYNKYIKINKDKKLCKKFYLNAEYQKVNKKN